MIEDNPGDVELVTIMLEEQSRVYELMHVDRLAGARESLSGDPVDCILLDLGLPDASGLEALEELRAVAPEAPVVVLTGQVEEDAGVAAVQHGAEDYLVKGLTNGEQLVRSVEFGIERHRRFEEMQERAMIDELTGLRNRRAFLSLADLAHQVAVRRKQRLVLLFIDADRMKSINDVWGHRRGDEALIDLARLMRGTFRESDLLARVGGDEFCVLLTGASDHAARSSIRRLRSAIDRHNLRSGRPYSLSLSVGMASTDPEDACSIDELMDRADGRMYDSKHELIDRTRILFVEDEEGLRGLLPLALEEEYDVATACSGLEALEQLERRHFDLVVLDKLLPGMSGDEVARELKGRDPELPVLMVSVDARPSAEESSRAAGVDDYLRKPFDMEELRARLSELLERVPG